MVGIEFRKNVETGQKEMQRLPDGYLLRANASALPFPDHTFDLVVSASAFHYFDQPKVSLEEMRRVVIPEAQWLFSIGEKLSDVPLVRPSL